MARQSIANRLEMGSIPVGDCDEIGRTSRLATALRWKRNEVQTLAGSTPVPSVLMAFRDVLLGERHNSKSCSRRFDSFHPCSSELCPWPSSKGTGVPSRNRWVRLPPDTEMTALINDGTKTTYSIPATTRCHRMGTFSHAA